jgi:hypothetical protein
VLFAKEAFARRGLNSDQNAIRAVKFAALLATLFASFTWAGGSTCSTHAAFRIWVLRAP